MLLERFWTGLAALAGWVTLSPFDQSPHQRPIALDTNTPNDVSIQANGPTFFPPGGDPTHNFTCDYSRMGRHWTECSIPENRECWLRNNLTGEEYNIHTDYEKIRPLGIDRYYTLYVNDSWVGADGLNFTDAKLFNNTYPGPWIEACWGDTIHVKVINDMKWNGTSIHWHGIRQNESMHMDGVNGVTQCPIAPGDSFTYSFNTTQYGSSWYHSHYSVQYSDGLQGPMTIHGPASAAFDIPKAPLLMTDWNHLSGFEVLEGFANDTAGRERQALVKPTILLNGRGDARKFNYTKESGVDIQPQYDLWFEGKRANETKRAKRYLLRLINTSFDTTFVFSIDNHWLQIIGADFVPIEPYFNTSVLVGIGQRYHVVVEANPDGSFNNGSYNNSIPTDSDGNFWIRMWVADECGIQAPKPVKGLTYETTGIIRYNKSSKALPNSKAWPELLVSKKCSDETYSSLRPKIPWYIGPAANKQNGPEGEQYNVSTNPGIPKPWPHAIFSLEPKKAPAKSWTPLRINYSDPTFSHLDYTPSQWLPEQVVLTENYTDNQWVYLVLSGYQKGTFGAHPIHLHGHDFAILQQEEGQGGKLAIFSPETYKPKFDNPPRRDVVLLPRNGFVVIAFKADNPGSWLMHCHIAFHASFGLAAQIVERSTDANRIWPKSGPAQIEAQRVCKNWDNFQNNDCKKWWPGEVTNKTTGEKSFPACKANPAKPNPPNSFWKFRDDSGI